jgi:DNA-binding NarL/FixJ family response regulator
MDTRVWIDDPNPIFRMGLACCLRRPGFELIGESSEFVPQPDLDRTDILVFDLGEQSLGWALGRAGARGVPEGPGARGTPEWSGEHRPARLLGLVGGGGPDRELTRGLCTVLVRSELTPTAFVDCLRSLADLCPRTPEPPPLPPPGLSEEELEVLRLLAQGEGPQGIARVLGFSRRAARGMVAGLVERLGARSPAQAVARAMQEGVI